MKKYWYIFVGIFVCLISFILIFYSGFYDSKQKSEEELIESCETKLDSKLDVNVDMVVNDDIETVFDHIYIKFDIDQKDINEETRNVITNLTLDLMKSEYQKNKDIIETQYSGYKYYIEVGVYNDRTDLMVLNYELNTSIFEIFDANDGECYDYPCKRSVIDSPEYGVKLCWIDLY